ncbi:glycosyltransferase family 25 protein [Vibrio mangrovi]|uniref:Glycosyltransferase family 25 (LPS biosynthesis protein) n=1 Tax=Vibrio mangrovi TaxID=474394 RepID=A0A1Y6IV63_9VIBR|nr:glycosyltransferase family 25 protein [Vibrio mangrovi]MDW6002210.1 glycosyltransferase family 25 protein [Vibrio mangrovi]SMS01555.1 Glycosyltransferase family 25 (LPS biosynthesis protein) [Vibrio mangrovi]
MKLYVINLERALERRKRVEKCLSELNVDFEFFNAVDGFKGLPIDLAAKPNDQYRIKYRGNPLTPGEKGVYASHFLLWKKCIELNEPIVILEDDFLPTLFFNQVIEKLPSLHEKYDYLRIEPQDNHIECNVFESTHDGFQIVMWRDNLGGARGYSITPSAADKFVSHSEEWLCAVDNFIGESYKHDVPAMGVIPYAIFNPSDMESQIQNIVKRIKVNPVNKIFRELNRVYRSLLLWLWNIRYLNNRK